MKDFSVMVQVLVKEAMNLKKKEEENLLFLKNLTKIQIEEEVRLMKCWPKFIQNLMNKYLLKKKKMITIKIQSNSNKILNNNNKSSKNKYKKIINNN